MTDANTDSDNEQLEVLNISNVNATGAIVLNDEKLLELIELYPFLYNPKIIPYNDEDYDEWAWERITLAFNRSYDDSHINILPFNNNELKMRWQTLQPIIKSLSKAYEIASIPDSLRQLVLRISVHLENSNKEDESAKPLSKAQAIILRNINVAQQLTLDKRKCLEADIMDFILNVELDAKANVSIDAERLKSIDQECELFFHSLGIEDCGTNGNYVEDESFTLPAPIKVKHEIENLFEPAENWIPLAEAHNYCRPCCVKIKRTNLEDYLPLAKIKRECNNVYIKRLL